MTMFMFNIWMLSSMIILLKHPLSVGLILLLQTINISLMTGLLMNNFWYSYMLFLIMIGGMLVLFLYMTNVASNEKFKFNIIMLILPMMISFMFSMLLNNSIKMNEINKFNYQFDIFLLMSKYFNFNLMMMYVMIIMYLLLTLIVVVKIIDINHGPLRSSN